MSTTIVLSPSKVVSGTAASWTEAVVLSGLIVSVVPGFGLRV